MLFLITGITGRLARLVAAVLAARPGATVLALGGSADGLAGVESLGAMPRGNALLALLQAQRPDVLIHLDHPGEEIPGTRGAPLHTVDLLGAAAASGVGRVVLRSSSFVYGAAANNPAFLTEQAPLSANQPGLIRDHLMVEGYAAEMARHARSTSLVVLRMAHILAGGVESPLAAYLRQPRPYMLAGFDPRFQLLHANDAVVAIVLAALGSAPGIFNIAADQLFLLSQLIQKAQRQPMPLPSAAFSMARIVKVLTEPIRAVLPFEPAFLQYSCIADTSLAKQQLGWQPAHTATETITAWLNEN